MNAPLYKIKLKFETSSQKSIRLKKFGNLAHPYPSQNIKRCLGITCIACMVILKIPSTLKLGRDESLPLGVTLVIVML